MLVVGDLSLVQNYRGTFNTEVQKGGVDGLIKALADKNRQAAAGLKLERSSPREAGGRTPS